VTWVELSELQFRVYEMSRGKASLPSVESHRQLLSYWLDVTCANRRRIKFVQVPFQGRAM
jgi:hypothetical protein